MGCLGEFVYIIDPMLYKMYLKKGLYKYIPEKLLIKYQKSIKPRKICEYIDINKNMVRGYGVGVFISYENISKEDYISRIIYAINSIKTDDTINMILDNIYKLNESEYNKIESACGLKIFNGRKEIVDAIVDSIKKICSIRKDKINEQEILIISDDTEDTKTIVLGLSNEINFLTILGNKKEYINELEKQVLLETGLSIHSTDNVTKTITNYNFIICMKDDIYIDVNKIRKKTIVIDASLHKSLSKLTEYMRKDLLVINDYIFKNEGSIISIPEEFNFGSEIGSYTHEALDCQWRKGFIKIRVNAESYTLNSALSLYMSNERNMSTFREK